MRRILLLAALVGCNANDPMYIQAPMTMEAGTPDPANMGKLSQAKASLQLPIKTETAADKKARDDLSAKLAPIQVPYVKVGDLEVDVEWTIKNLDTNDGVADVELNGANELFSYDPSMINLAPPGDDEAPPTPGLSGDIPIHIPAGATVSGLFTEDDVREASVDLDEITRGNITPFRATLTIDRNQQSFQPLTAPTLDANGQITQSPTGPVVPRSAFAQLTRIDLVFKPDRHMTLSFNVRVRDLRGIMDDMLLAAKPAELQMFDPMAYAPDLGAPPTP
ncbi:MAG TPA: hypothetical protein VHW23_21820 [Kofleriaceae bacterium]|jgi:hypothetical protein|nr:hypothetical protein [Kofleriaceae bacterium]